VFPDFGAWTPARRCTRASTTQQHSQLTGAKREVRERWLRHNPGDHEFHIMYVSVDIGCGAGMDLLLAAQAVGAMR
jgi:hypothetical protein